MRTTWIPRSSSPLQEQSRLRRPAVHLPRRSAQSTTDIWDLDHQNTSSGVYRGIYADDESDRDERILDAHRPGAPQILPMPPPAPSATMDGQRKRKRKRKWKNGCGAQVHGGAVPVSARFGASAGGFGSGAGGIGFGLGGGSGWRAPRAGVEGTVVPLEARYFSREARAALRLGAAGDEGEGGDGGRRDVCGCCVQGVGCAVW
ncbi:hypothetical protein C8J57DRAFT_1705180 [Mycena rebaudengoi]|nr:hypothetical protein C8J57DRAFT_1705180 [Mycena rebaudengoi]